MLHIYQFFRLIRFANIVVIVLTMCIFYALLSNYNAARQYYIPDEWGDALNASPGFMETVGLTDLNFMLLIISVVLIAASGNIINDYFDQKADRVNKPNRLIIDKYIKRRWAIILNWTFNGIGFILALYLSYRLQNWWIILISFVSINLLYFYSAIYKRKFLTGNIIVAFLTAIVPLYVYVYAVHSNFGVASPFGNVDNVFAGETILIVAAYCVYAFLFNLIREIIKDMADVKGDLLLGSQTIPIRFGFKKTKYLLGVLYFIALTPLIYIIYTGFMIGPLLPETASDFMYFFYFLLAVLFAMLVSAYILFSKNQRKYYLLASNAIKFALLFGVISALFYA